MIKTTITIMIITRIIIVTFHATIIISKKMKTKYTHYISSTRRDSQDICQTRVPNGQTCRKGPLSIISTAEKRNTIINKIKQ